MELGTLVVLAGGGRVGVPESLRSCVLATMKLLGLIGGDGCPCGRTSSVGPVPCGANRGRRLRAVGAGRQPAIIRRSRCATWRCPGLGGLSG